MAINDSFTISTFSIFIKSISSMTTIHTPTKSKFIIIFVTSLPTNIFHIHFFSSFITLFHIIEFTNEDRESSCRFIFITTNKSNRIDNFVDSVVHHSTVREW
jgi:hypothetical protein